MLGMQATRARKGPGLTSTARSAVLLILGWVALGGIAAGDLLPVDVDVKARGIRPGEPVRIEVTSPAPLRSLQGEFLGREVFMVRTRSQPGGEETWSGWSMIDLDGKPGPAAVDVSGVAADGRRVVGTRAVTVEDFSFPEEALKVASGYVEPPPDVQARLARERKRIAAVYESRIPRAAVTRPFVRPVPGDSTSVFGTRRTFNGKPRAPHPGIDLRAPVGTSVRSAGGGTVGLAADLYRPLRRHRPRHGTAPSLGSQDRRHAFRSDCPARRSAVLNAES